MKNFLFAHLLLTKLISYVKKSFIKRIYLFLSVKFVFLQKISKKDLNLQHQQQNTYCLPKLEENDTFHIFIVPGKKSISGGVISIYNFSAIVREISASHHSVICTHPGIHTHASNDNFDNSENVYRWEQIIPLISVAKNCFIHLPECYVYTFSLALKEKKIKKIQMHTNLHINILNQNIDLMPKLKDIKKLYTLTKNITHSVGFKKSATQEVCNAYELPMYYLPSFVDLEKNVRFDYENKEKIILYSPDFNENKLEILTYLKEELNDFQFIEIKNIKYENFLNLIAKAMFCISFGEGFDGYYIQPYYAGSIGVTVYNDVFFYYDEIKYFPFVYSSYEDMKENIANDIKNIYKNETQFTNISNNTLSFFRKKINNRDKTKKSFSDIVTNSYHFKPVNSTIKI